MGVSCVGVHAVTSRRVFYESFFVADGRHDAAARWST